MKIENTGFYSIFSSKLKKETPVKEVDEKRSLIQKKDEMATLNKEAKEMNELFKLMTFEEVVREEKLEDIRQKMDSDKYHVTGKDVLSTLMGEK